MKILHRRAALGLPTPLVNRLRHVYCHAASRGQLRVDFRAKTTSGPKLLSNLQERRSTMPKTLKVLVATPLGQGGNGGIDRLMDAVRGQLAAHPRNDATITFGTTRGQGSIALAPVALARFLLSLTSRPDVVHINLSSYGSTYRKLIVAGACRLLGLPYVLHLHGSLYMKFWQGASPRLNALIVGMFSHAAGVMVLGEAWRRFVAERAPNARLYVVPNASGRPTLAHVPSDVVRLVFLGKVGERKGTFDLIAALAPLRDVPGWQAVLAGDGEVDKARAMVDEAGLGDKVSVPGWAGPDDVARMVAHSDVLVLPSYNENLPMSVIEGMAAGLAVVTTPVGATTDIITDGVTGLLVEPGDIAGLSAALGRVIGDGALRASLGQAALALHRQKLDLEPYVENLVSIWKECAR
jgi:glycosyltransferase involved in cell wall biosynthesis